MRGAAALALLALFPVGASRAAAQATTPPNEDRIRPGPDPIAIARLSGPITLDGVVDEPAWEAIAPLEMIMYSPTWGGTPTVPTEVRIGYDDRYLYMSGRMFVDDPHDIRANTLYRDQFSGDDLLSIMIDSYNDYETAVWFVTNPDGARSDRTMSNDGESSGGGGGGGGGGGRGGMRGGAMNSDWNSQWDVATTRSDEGWFAEFRIPFSTLGFQARDGEVTMGVTVYRFIGRNNERQLFPAIEQEWGSFGFGKPSQAQRMTLRDVQPSKPVYVTPYLLGGLTQVPVLREPPDVSAAEWQTDSDPTREIGLDLKFAPTSNISMDLTANTDFAQVEADDQQINLTRFPLFFPEKRQFFQERASTFEFATGGSTDRLFFSRRIGLDEEEGEIVPIYGGARVVGRAGGLDFGFLDMQTRSIDTRSSENMGVLRLNQQIFNPYSSIGAMVTSRVGADGQDNVAYGVDTDLRVFGDEYLTLKWAQTFDQEVEEGDALDAGLIRAVWERRKDDGISYQLQYGRVGRDFLPRLGFQLRTDYSLYGGNLQYSWLPGPRSPLRTVTLGARTSHYIRNEDHRADSRAIDPSLRFDFKSGANIGLSGAMDYESILEEFEIAGLAIPAGNYWFRQGTLSLSLPRNGLFRGSVRGSWGSFYDGTRASASVSPTWNLSKHLELTGNYQINRISFADRGLRATTHLASLKAAVALDTHFSVSAFLQYNSLDDQTSLNARMRYNFREGTDLWIVYNEAYNHERENGIDPRLPFSAGRTLMVKYTHTFIW